MQISDRYPDADETVGILTYTNSPDFRPDVDGLTPVQVSWLIVHDTTGVLTAMVLGSGYGCYRRHRLIIGWVFIARYARLSGILHSSISGRIRCAEHVFCYSPRHPDKEHTITQANNIHRARKENYADAG